MRPSSNHLLYWRDWLPFNSEGYWAKLHSHRLFQQRNHSSSERRWGLIEFFCVFMTFLTACLIGAIYSFNKIKKAIENLQLKRKAGISKLRLCAALLGACAGIFLGAKLGLSSTAVFFLGSLSVPFFVVTGAFCMMALGIFLTKHLLRYVHRWIYGYSNSGAESVSYEAIRHYQQKMRNKNITPDLNATHLGKIGLMRSVLYRLKATPTATDAHNFPELYQKLKQGNHWGTQESPDPTLGPVFINLFEVTLQKAKEEYKTHTTSATQQEACTLASIVGETVVEDSFTKVEEDASQRAALKKWCRLS